MKVLQDSIMEEEVMDRSDVQRTLAIIEALRWIDSVDHEMSLVWQCATRWVSNLT